MSEFLHNLRSGKFKRNDRNNWSQNDKNYRGSHRRGDADNRKGHPSSQRHDSRSTAFNEAVSKVKGILEDIATSHARFADAYELKARADERKADALESIAGLLKQRFGGDKVLADDLTDLASPAVPSENSADLNQEQDQEQLLNNILDMRKEGLSYDKIAQHLESEGVPTFSGRGKWRGQAISKLCKEIQ
jgi:hypothetical protein